LKYPILAAQDLSPDLVEEWLARERALWLAQRSRLAAGPLLGLGRHHTAWDRVGGSLQNTWGLEDIWGPVEQESRRLGSRVGAAGRTRH